MPSIEDHPLRYKLANELHARPFPRMAAPCTVAFIAIKQPTEASQRNRADDFNHLIELLDRHGSPHPTPNSTHFSGTIGRHNLKWEQHTEFITYTAFSEGISDRPFDPSSFDIFPDEWLGRAPGQRITSSIIRIALLEDDRCIEPYLSEWFVSESLAVSWIIDGEGIAASDFRIDTSGHMRLAVFVSPKTAQRRIGRIVQRLCEIETYKSMSMLGFSRVRDLSHQINTLDTNLTNLMGEMTGNVVPADETLPKLLSISAELEEMVARCSFRLAATNAYRALVTQRIAALREKRFQGRQTFAEFMMRRYEPAMRTVKSTEKRIQSLADRALRAGNLLRTRVDVERSAQNQKLLESMNKRADLQLRLQRTVEGLSVVAISYYAVSLATYMLSPLTEMTNVNDGLLIMFITLPVILIVWGMVRRIRKNLE
ncbi:MAG: DUF3422 domain-containing protein [Aestuariivita sp.]|nr:DUF3422 domain-containing protein [Aestuariivita sp.]